MVIFGDYIFVCSGSVVVTAYDFEFGRPGSNPEWGLICYKASITAQVLPEPSSLRDSTLGTRAAELCCSGTQSDQYESDPSLWPSGIGSRLGRNRL